MTRPRQKQEGKRKGYGKFLPVRKNANVEALQEMLDRAPTYLRFNTGMVMTPIAPSLISAVWINGKRRTVAELIANGKRKFESAQKAAGKEGT